MPLTQQLVEKYQPHHIRDFVGLKPIKEILTGFVASPYPSNWLFSGDPGLGKTCMALALANDLPAEQHEDVFKEILTGGNRLYHYYSNQVNLELVARIKEDFQLQMFNHGNWTVYLIDEVDEITYPAYIAFL